MLYEKRGIMLGQLAQRESPYHRRNVKPSPRGEGGTAQAVTDEVGRLPLLQSSGKAEAQTARP